MQRARLSGILFLLFMLVLTSCDSPTSAIERGDQAMESESLEKEVDEKGNKYLASATGSGHYVDVRQDEEGNEIVGFRNFSFTARATEDGAKGSWQLISRAFEELTGDSKNFHGSVSCLAVDGNKAWFAGPEKENPDVIRGILVVDNGQGGGADPDQVSVAYNVELNVGLASAEEWCQAQYPPEWLSMFDVERGNLQVR